MDPKIGWKEISFYVGNLAVLGWFLYVFVWHLNSGASELVGRGDARVWNNIDFLGAKMQLLCFFVVVRGDAIFEESLGKNRKNTSDIF